MRRAAAGLTAEEIAARMLLTQAFISTYFKRLNRCLGVSGRPELVAMPYQTGLLSSVPERG